MIDKCFQSNLGYKGKKNNFPSEYKYRCSGTGKFDNYSYLEHDRLWQAMATLIITHICNNYDLRYVSLKLLC